MSATPLQLLSALVCLGAIALQSGPAHAQNRAIERFEPTPAGDVLLANADPEVNGQLAPRFGFVLSLAEKPLVLRREDSDFGDVVQRQLVGHLQASFELFQRLEAEVDLPATLATTGESPELGGTRFTSPSGAALADLRLGAKVALFGRNEAPASVSFAFRTWLPTGDEDSYSGSDEARFALGLDAGRDHASWLWRASIFRRFQSSAGSNLDSVGSDLGFGLGGALRFSALAIGAELFGSTRASDDEDVFSARTTPLEALGSVHYRVGPLALRAGAGPGLTRAAGTPRFRAVLSVAFSFDAGVGEGTDADGRAGTETAARARAPATLVADIDGDGIGDREDRCPARVGVENVEPKLRGCPPDRDRDGVFDTDDRCPETPGAPSVEAARNGCPADRDGDDVIDRDDACPAESGPRTQDPATNGCPDAVRVEGTRIAILEPVMFETRGDRVEPRSEKILAQVASAMKQHPEIARIAVDGHTDSVGTEPANLALSRRRAIAVVRWLVGAGVDERRLEARGFGPRRPIADNATEAGRAKNRRVEFLILKRTEKGKDGWKDGPIP